MQHRPRGFSLIELLASMAVIAILLSSVGMLWMRTNTESQAMAWNDGARQVLQSVRDGYKTQDDYSTLSYSVAVANNWVPLALQSPGGATTGQVPWGGSWSIGVYAGAPIREPLFLTVVFAANQGSSCIAVTNAMLASAAEIGFVEGWAWYVPSQTQTDPTIVSRVCTNGAGAHTMMYGFPY